MYSIQTAVSDGTLKQITLGLEFIDTSHIHVYRSDIGTELVLTTDYNWDGVTKIDFVATVPNGVTVTLIRRTVYDEILNSFSGGTPFLRTALEENFQQLLFIGQETVECGVTQNFYRNINMHGNTIENTAYPVDAGDVATKGYVDTQDAALDARVDVLEGLVPSATQYYTTIASGGNSVFSPPYVFTRCNLYVDGIYQTPIQNYTIVDNAIQLNGWTTVSGQQVSAEIFID